MKMANSPLYLSTFVNDRRAHTRRQQLATPGSTRGLLPLLRVRNYRWGTRGHRIVGLRKSVPRLATYDDWNWDI